jgi:hypothetical protein
MAAPVLLSYTRASAAQHGAKGEGVSNEALGNETAEQAIAGPAEAWERWETVLVVSSIGFGIVGLVLLGFLVDRFILP